MTKMFEKYSIYNGDTKYGYRIQKPAYCGINLKIVCWYHSRPFLQAALQQHEKIRFTKRHPSMGWAKTQSQRLKSRRNLLEFLNSLKSVRLLWCLPFGDKLHLDRSKIVVSSNSMRFEQQIKISKSRIGYEIVKE